MSKRLALLGSTGSIGTSTIEVVRHLRDQAEIVALAAGSNIDLLIKQAQELRPKMVALFDASKADTLRKALPGVEIVTGMEGLEAVATHPDADMVISAISGTTGLQPTIAAIQAGKDVGLANKEALVSGGELVMGLVEKHGVKLLPIDSEHSALFQCLHGENPETVRKLILTASGGPFRGWKREQLEAITVEQALNHPTWSMGAKVTIDSSTLMNKGLEVIEAHWLFGMPPEKIDVIVHPQSIVHSLVEFVDNSLLAQVGEPSMKTPIQYAITYPERKPGSLKPFSFTTLLEFTPPQRDLFPCLDLAYRAIKTGKSLPCYMNAANEVLVERFLKKEIRWTEISALLQKLMEQHTPISVTTLEEILAVDAQARREGAKVVAI